MIISQNKTSLDLLQDISLTINDKTFHHHYYTLYDIASTYDANYSINYVEIGCYAGGSACLMISRPNTNVISIDLGHPIKPDEAISNVKKFNIHSNLYEYLQGNSQSAEMVERLEKIVSEIDILFIDGDHSYQGVINDYALYEPLVRSNGFIVFDDYRDSSYSPDVKPAVDIIISSNKSKLNVIGTMPNIYNARPDSLKDGNVFIVQKI